MPDDNDSSSNAAVASSTAATSSTATKRNHNEMEMTNNETSTSNNETSINTKIDNDALFASGMEGLRLAEKELALAQKRVEQAQQHMEGIRQQIRDSGEYEPDSLLFLCDGEDNNILSLIMGYLAVEEVGRCELVCSILKKQAVQYWVDLDTLLFANPALRSPSAQSPREAAIRYKVASTLAERIGDMGDSISRHMIVSEFNNDTYTSTHKRIHDDCEGCSFPNLNFQPFRRRTSVDYELFVRFCQTSDNKLLAEGFVPCTRNRMQLRKLDFSNWPRFVEITHLIDTSEAEGDPFANDNILEACMRDLTVVVVGVQTDTSEVSLSLAQCNFSYRYAPPYIRRNGSGFCKPQGRMSVKSHGSVETRSIQYETTAALVNKFCEANLELRWNSHVQTDHNSGEIPKKECRWVLDCICTYKDEDYYGEEYRREMS